MAKPLVEVVERLTGRRVVNYQGQVVFDPDVDIKIFVFADRLRGDDVDTSVPPASSAPS
jgi:hypothetical protein